MVQDKMSPGVYEDLSFADYLAIDAVNNGSLSELKQSPRHYRERAGLEKTKPLLLGSLIHTGRLEPLALADRYAVLPDYQNDEQNVTAAGERSTSKTTKYYRAKAAAFREANSRREIVLADWYAEMVAIVMSLERSSLAQRVLTCQRYELTLVWEDAPSGLLCKARLDAVAPGAHFADLKSTARLDKFSRAIADYGYHRQMAHYQEGWRVLTGETLPPWLVVVESAPPYCVQAAPMDEETVAAGFHERADLLGELAGCLARDEWPGPPSPKAWRLPEWAMQKNEPCVLTISGRKVNL